MCNKNSHDPEWNGLFSIQWCKLSNLKKKFQTKESRKKSSFNEKRMEKNIIAQWFVKNMELHFCLSKWKTESIVCALIYPNAHLSEKIEFLPCINNSTHYATHCKPKIRPFAVMGCELNDVWFAYSLQLNNCFLCYSLCYCCCFCCWLLPCYCYCCGGCWLLALQSSKLKNLASNWNTLRSMEMFTIRSTVNAICNYNSENSNFNFSVKHSNYY